MIERYLQLVSDIQQQDIASFLKNLRGKFLTALNGPYFSEKSKNYFQNVSPDGEPFRNFETEPKQIVQIKQAINALYHAEEAFKVLQSLNLKYSQISVNDIKKLSAMIEHGYKASYLLTHLDIDFNEILGGEIKHVISLLEPIREFAKDYEKGAIEFQTAVKTYPIVRQAGKVSGIAITQMKPNGESYDYDFLAKFSADLPGYIAQLTTLLQKSIPQISTYQPKISKEKLDELQEEALKLLRAIENTQSGDILVSVQAINYIHIIRQIITLSMSSLEQIGYANDSSQQFIRHNLEQLKYDLLPTLLNLADRLEDEALLKPGTLSHPLMAQLKPLYKLISIYAAKIVDFAPEGEPLLGIQDSHFVQTRLGVIRSRITTAQWNLAKLHLTKAHVENFFKIIDDTQYNSFNLLNLPEDVKTALKEEYKFLIPYVRAFDPDLANQIAQSLIGRNTYVSIFANSLYRLVGSYDPTAIPNLRTLKKQLLTQFVKDENTQNFHIALNEDLIKSIGDQIDLELYPYQTRTVGFDESIALGVDAKAKEQAHLNFQISPESTRVVNVEALTFEQAKRVYQYHANNHMQLLEAQQAFEEFLIIFNRTAQPLNHITDSILKSQLRSLYSQFQNFLVENSMDQQEIRREDKAIVAALNEDHLDLTKPAIRFSCFDEENIASMSSYFAIATTDFEQKAATFKALAETKYTQQITKDTLRTDTNATRARYLIKHTNYSQMVAAYRSSFQQLTSIFNESVRNRIIPNKTSGVPFPEIENKELLVQEVQQVLFIKRIFNSLYYLEQTCLELEKLDKNSTQTMYVYHLIQAKGHIDELLDLTKHLAADPHLSLLVTELKDKALSLYHIFSQQTDNYAVASTGLKLDDPKLNDKTVRYNGLWYTIRSFMFIPEHIKTTLSDSTISSETAENVNERSKRAVLNIERIIQNSDSYFKLFLETPTIYSLYKELKGKLKEFTTLSHETAMNNLETLNHDLFARFLAEADQWEDKLGLKAGLLSEPLKGILDEFYKNLLEPLRLPSNELIALINNPVSTGNRIADVKKSIAEAKKQLIRKEVFHYDDLDTDKYRLPNVSLSNKALLIEELLNAMQSYNNLNRFVPASDLTLAMMQSKLIKLYKAALPILIEDGKQLDLPKVPVESTYRNVEIVLQEYSFNPDTGKVERKAEGTSQDIRENPKDKIQEDQSKPASPSIKHIALTILNHYKGLHNSAQFKVDTANERLAYFEQLKAKQHNTTHQYIKEYTKIAYDRELNTAVSKNIGLVHMNKEYKESLKAYLKLSEVEHRQIAEEALNIDGEIRDLLAAETAQFNQTNLVMYTELETIRLSLTQFDCYLGSFFKQNSFSKHAIFESADTLNKKKAIIEGLKTIAADSTLSVETRIHKISIEVSKQDFTRDMFAYHHYDTFSFKWLAQCVMSILSALNLYTPKYEKLAINLQKAAAPQPNRARFFTPAATSNGSSDGSHTAAVVKTISASATVGFFEPAISNRSSDDPRTTSVLDIPSTFATS